MSEPLRIAIIGAGVAGAILARRLARLPQLSVTCLERVGPNDHSEAGTGLNVGPNAIKALTRCDPALAEAVEKHTPKLIVGGGNAMDRHHALEIGEIQPDYIFFGKIGGFVHAMGLLVQYRLRGKPKRPNCKSERRTRAKVSDTA